LIHVADDVKKELLV